MSATAQNGRARVPRIPAVIDPPRSGSALMAALLQVQAEAPKLGRNAEGKVQGQSKQGRAFDYTYRYVTLDAVVDAVLPLLVKHELTWATFPTADEHGNPALRYRITHVPSGEFEEDAMPLAVEKPGPQGQGSAITYARRYSMLAVLNLTTGEDDDGQAASEPVRTVADVHVASIDAPEHDRAPAMVQPTARPAASTSRPCSAKQQGMLQARARAAELTPAEFANIILTAAGEPTRTWQSHEAAQQTLSRLLDKLPWTLVDPVLARIAAKASA